jgi:V8-like Glu-specific endopeptidase
MGDQGAPEELESVMQRRPIPGEGDPPAEFARARTTRTVYIPGGKRGAKPEIDLESVKGVENGGYWKVSFDLPSPDARHLPGNTAERKRPQEITAEVDRRIGVSGSRPDWMAATYYPRPLPGLGRPVAMRRINGRAVTPLYVFGPDDRVVYTDSSWPWGLVGKVFTSGGWVGSGALIGPRLVATAGHVVPWGSGSWWMRFVPAYYNGSSLHGAGVESYVSDARGYDTSGSVTGYDWAVLRLYQPLGDWLGYFGYNGYSSSWEDHPYWTVLGYPGAVGSGQRPSYQNGVSTFDDDSDSNGGLELETKADMTPGNSGGPMFGWWSGDPRLVGVVSGQEEDWSPGVWPWEWADVEMGNVVAGGSGFTNLMAWGRTNWS